LKKLFLHFVKKSFSVIALVKHKLFQLLWDKTFSKTERLKYDLGSGLVMGSGQIFLTHFRSFDYQFFMILPWIKKNLSGKAGPLFTMGQKNARVGSGQGPTLVWAI